MDYILSIHRVLLYKNMNPANGFFVRARGLSLKIFDWLQIFRHGNLSANEHAMQFFYAKTYRFCADFPIFPVGAAICRPPKCVAFSYIFPRLRGI